jgi:hypothetical protein
MPQRRVVIAAWSVGVLLSALVLLTLGELTLRLIHFVRDGIPFWEAPSGAVGAITLDPRLGWRATAHYIRDLSDTTQQGIVYRVHRSQTEFGFRSFGDARAGRGKLLVIGDSYTQATAVSDDKTYHALVGQMLGMEVFAYGAGGYGTLQEYLILDEVVDQIRPSMLLWQFCSNDFINNDHALEVASTLNNNGWTRPYWEDGAIVLRSPKLTSVQIRDWIQHHSRFLYFLMSRIDRLGARAGADSVEYAIERQGVAHPGFARAVRVTDELMGCVRARVGPIPIYAFNCDAFEPYTTAWEDIARHHHILFWRDVGASVDQALKAGHDVLASSDGHWNEHGHALIAQNLAVHLQQSRYVAAK